MFVWWVWGLGFLVIFLLHFEENQAAELGLDLLQ